MRHAVRDSTAKYLFQAPAHRLAGEHDDQLELNLGQVGGRAEIVRAGDEYRPNVRDVQQHEVVVDELEHKILDNH
jgi:hypothetical protein